MLLHLINISEGVRANMHRAEADGGDAVSDDQPVFMPVKMLSTHTGRSSGARCEEILVTLMRAHHDEYLPPQH